jgi:DNA-binding NarL/FixJ family response regulator
VIDHSTSGRPSATVIVADDLYVVREGFRVLLESFGLEVLGGASSPEQSVAQLARLEPDAVILNIAMRDADPAKTIGALRQVNPQCAVITYSGFNEDGPSDEPAVTFADAHVHLRRTRREMVQAILDAVARRRA